MIVTCLVENMLKACQVQGKVPTLIAVSPDIYNVWQDEFNGKEPTSYMGVNIGIRDMFKPKTIVVFEDKDMLSPDAEMAFESSETGV